MRDSMYFNDEWICAHLGDDYEGFKGAVVPPIFQNSLNVFPTAEDMIQYWETLRETGVETRHMYGRVSNPTIQILEKKIAALERAEACLCCGSGMAAITSSLIHFLSAEDHVIAVGQNYGRGFLDYLARFKIAHTLVSGRNIDEFEQAIQKTTKVIYLESPSSMFFALQDLEAIACLARSKGIITIIDNTYSTPIFQKPIPLGIDLTVHSMSKYIGGHSDIIGGAITGTQEHVKAIAKAERGTLGGILHPFEGWLALRGIRTLPIRMKQHQQSGMKVAEYLHQHEKIMDVFYPGLESHPQHQLAKKQMTGYSGLMSFTMDTTMEKAIAFVNNLEIFQIGVSWGGFESLIINPRLVDLDGKSKILTRIHIGLENVDDILNDLELAAEKL